MSIGIKHSILLEKQLYIHEGVVRGQAGKVRWRHKGANGRLSSLYLILQGATDNFKNRIES